MMKEFIEQQIMFDVVPWKLHAVKPGQAFLEGGMIMIIIFITRSSVQGLNIQNTINKASNSKEAKSNATPKVTKYQRHNFII